MTTYPKNTGRMLDRTTDGRALSFAVDSPQRYRDDWRQTGRIMRYYGSCSCCGIRTYGHDDGEDDPRGVLGDHAADPITLSEHVSEADAIALTKTGTDVTIPACFCCTNDYDRYQYLINKAVRTARKKGADL